MDRKLTKDEVRHVALLARLALDEGELDRYSTQLGSILSYMEKLNRLDIAGVQPTSHPIETLKNVFRKDELKKSLSSGDALANAPQGADTGGFFKVPKIIEGK